MVRPEEADSFDDSIHIRCWSWQRKKLHELATQKGLTVSQYIRGQWIREFKRKGIL